MFSLYLALIVICTLTQVQYMQSTLAHMMFYEEVCLKYNLKLLLILFLINHTGGKSVQNSDGIMMVCGKCQKSLQQSLNILQQSDIGENTVLSYVSVERFGLPVGATLFQ